MNDIIKELRSAHPDWYGDVPTLYSKAADIIEQQAARIAELEARSAQDVHDISKLLDTIKYLRGIAERGMRRKQIDTESVEQFVLGYVKQLEADSAMIAESQAREQQMREFVVKLIKATPGHAGQCSGLKCREQYCYSCNDEESADAYLQEVWDLCHEAKKALAIPTDTTALEAIVRRVSDMMRERCLSEIDPKYYSHEPAKHIVEGCCNDIRTLPGVTMEDLKGNE